MQGAPKRLHINHVPQGNATPATPLCQASRANAYARSKTPASLQRLHPRPPTARGHSRFTAKHILWTGHPVPVLLADQSHAQHSLSGLSAPFVAFDFGLGNPFQDLIAQLLVVKLGQTILTSGRRRFRAMPTTHPAESGRMQLDDSK